LNPKDEEVKKDLDMGANWERWRGEVTIALKQICDDIDKIEKDVVIVRDRMQSLEIRFAGIAAIISIVVSVITAVITAILMKSLFGE